MLSGSQAGAGRDPFPTCLGKSCNTSTDPARRQSIPGEEGSFLMPCRAKPRACTQLGGQGPSPQHPGVPTSHLVATTSPKGLLSFPSQTSLRQTKTPEEGTIPYAAVIRGAGSSPRRLSRNSSQLLPVVPQPASLACTGLTPAPRPHNDSKACESED